jgi:hypothetical protein
MRRNLSLILLLVACGVTAAQHPEKPILIAKPESFQTLVHPDCSHCQIEGKRRK